MKRKKAHLYISTLRWDPRESIYFAVMMILDLLIRVSLNDWITIISFVNSKSNPPVYTAEVKCVCRSAHLVWIMICLWNRNPKRKVWNCVSAAAKRLLSNVTNVGCVRPFSLSPTLGTTASSLACKPQTLTHTHTILYPGVHFKHQRSFSPHAAGSIRAQGTAVRKPYRMQNM